jgi:ribosomal RNA assembly protein
MNEKLIFYYGKEELSNIIGKKGRKIKRIKKELGIDVKIDENLEIDKKKCKLNDFELQNIFDALAMGFDVDTCLKLRDFNYDFFRLDLKSLRESRRRIIKGRILGREGKIKKIIEENTDCKLKIFKNKIGIIGESENVEIAKRAVEMLMRGKDFNAVKRWLEKEVSKLEKAKEILARDLAEDLKDFM